MYQQSVAMRFVRFGILLLAFCAPARPAMSQVSIGPLGYVPSTSRSGAEDISADGFVIVGRSSMFDSDEQPVWMHAFGWTEESGTMGLSGLPDDLNSRAHAASRDGSVFVGEDHTLRAAIEGSNAHPGCQCISFPI